MEPVCENVNDHLFGHQVNEDNINGADANGDGGVCTDKEVQNCIMTHANYQKREMVKE